MIPVLEWFASCQIITKNSVADAYRLEAEQLKMLITGERLPLCCVLQILGYRLCKCAIQVLLSLNTVTSLQISSPFTRYETPTGIHLPYAVKYGRGIRRHQQLFQTDRRCEKDFRPGNASLWLMIWMHTCILSWPGIWFPYLTAQNLIPKAGSVDFHISQHQSSWI